MSVVCLLLGGWGSNNKYALLGAFRAVAQLVSYEVPMVISLLVPIILARSMSLNSIAEAQVIPYLLVVPVSAIIFYISALAETGRTPFDLLEAESEIVAGFHVEYGGMKFGMFFLAEFISTLFMSSLFATIYWGGYRFFLWEWFIGDTPAAIELAIFFVKTFAVYFVFIWVRATFARVRIDQMLNFNWKFLVPLTLVLILATALVDGLFIGREADVAGLRIIAHLGFNLLIGLGALMFASRNAEERGVAKPEENTIIKAGALIEGADPHGHGHDDHGHHDDHAAAAPAHD